MFRVFFGVVTAISIGACSSKINPNVELSSSLAIAPVSLNTSTAYSLSGGTIDGSCDARTKEIEISLDSGETWTPLSDHATDLSQNCRESNTFSAKLNLAGANLDKARVDGLIQLLVRTRNGQQLSEPMKFFIRQDFNLANVLTFEGGVGGTYTFKAGDTVYLVLKVTDNSGKGIGGLKLGSYAPKLTLSGSNIAIDSVMSSAWLNQPTDPANGLVKLPVIFAKVGTYTLEIGGNNASGDSIAKNKISVTFSVLPNAGSYLTLSDWPAARTADGQVFQSAIELYDKAGNKLSLDSNGLLNLSIRRNGATVVTGWPTNLANDISASTMVRLGAQVISLNTMAAGTYQLVASLKSNPSVAMTSSPMYLSAGPAANYQISGPTEVTKNKNATFGVAFKDQYGNPVARDWSGLKPIVKYAGSNVFSDVTSPNLSNAGQFSFQVTPNNGLGHVLRLSDLTPLADFSFKTVDSAASYLRVKSVSAGSFQYNYSATQTLPINAGPQATGESVTIRFDLLGSDLDSIALGSSDLTIFVNGTPEGALNNSEYQVSKSAFASELQAIVLMKKSGSATISARSSQSKGDLTSLAMTTNILAPTLSPSLQTLTSDEDLPLTFQFSIGSAVSGLSCASLVPANSFSDSKGIFNLSAQGLVVAGTSPNCTVTASPNANANGSGELNFSTTGGSAKVNYTVTPKDDPASFAISQNSVTWDENSTSNTIDLVITDIDGLSNGDSCAKISVSGDQNVNLASAPSEARSANSLTCSFRLTGTANYYGTSIGLSIKYDGVAQKNLTATIQNINSSPVFTYAGSNNLNGTEDLSLVISNIHISDIETVLSCSNILVSFDSSKILSALGSAKVGGGVGDCVVTVTPKANFTGSAGLDLRISDGAADSGTTSLYLNFQNDNSDLPHGLQNGQASIDLGTIDECLGSHLVIHLAATGLSVATCSATENTSNQGDPLLNLGNCAIAADNGSVSIDLSPTEAFWKNSFSRNQTARINFSLGANSQDGPTNFTADVRLAIGSWSPKCLENSRSHVLAMWTDASRTNTLSVQGSSNAVRVWSDLSGNNAHLNDDQNNNANSTAGNFVLSESNDLQNGLQTIKGTNGRLQVDPNHQKSFGEVFGTMKFANGALSSGDRLFSSTNSQSATQAIYLSPDKHSLSVTGFDSIELNGVSQTDTSNQWVVLGAKATTNLNGLFVGGISSKHLDFLTVGEIIWCESGCWNDSGIKSLLEGYLAHKWGLQGTLPNSHPYMANSP